MTTDRDFKRLVRGRMKKTGESYTAARSRLLEKTGARASKPARKNGAAPAAAIRYAELAGLSDATILAKTGCTWEKWVAALDYKKAYEWPHGKIADYVHRTFGVPRWWTQWVTTGYERIKGLRAIGQRRGGGYEVGRSRTFPVPVARLYRSLSDKRSRAKWLPGDMTVRTASINKSMRLSLPDGTTVQVSFVSKGVAKSTIHVQHSKLADKAASDQAKQFWSDRLSALGDLLS
ncbi:MAG TPA: hypothetical protein VNO33_06550 [Kofleriaceae bacterium]|nr:hypothetical protein [Kofleriaceae bacterium]